MLYQCGDGGVSQIIPMEGGPNARPPPPVRGTQMEALEACKNPNFQPEQEEQDMKKRLLSAALALAMVLTMLPLTAFAIDPTPNGTQLTSSLSDAVSVRWYNQGDRLLAKGSGAGEDEVLATASAYYHVGTLKGINGNDVSGTTARSIYYAADGVLVGSTWYSSVENAVGDGKISDTDTCKVNKGRASSIKLIGSNNTLDVSKAKVSSLTVDLNGQPLTLSGSLIQDYVDAANKDQNTKLTSLTINNTVKTDAGKWPAVTGSITATSQNFSYTAKNTGGDGPSITVNNGSNVTTARTLSVTLTDAVVGALSVQDGAATVRVTATTKDAAAAGTIKVNESTSNLKNINYGTTSITVSGGKVGAITLNGKGTISLSDMATAKAITLFGGQKGTSGAAATSLPAWGGSTTVNVGSQCVTGAITTATDNEASMTVNVTGGSGSTSGVASIDFATAGTATTAHTVKVDGGKVGAIKLNAGTLTIGNGANTDAVTLSAGGKTTATISGTGTKVASVGAGDSKDITLNITGGEITGSITLPTGYAKHTITGGTFGTAITNAGWLGSVNYQIKSNNKFTYTSSFQACVDAQKGDSSAECSVVGASNTFDVKFILDAPTGEKDPDPVVTIKTDGSHGIVLPSKINNKTITTWYVGNNNEPKNAGALMVFSAAETVKATTSSADNSNIVAVKVHEDDKNGGLSATLAGNTIQVSGALPTGSNGVIAIDLEVETAIGQKYKVTVHYAVAEKKLVAGTQNAPFAAGSDNASIQIVGTSLIYPLDGSRLTVSAGSIKNVTLTGTKAVGTVSLSLGTAEKAALKAELDAITADFSDSSAVKEALNKVIAGLSQSQVDNYIRQGRIAAWKDDPANKGNPSEDQINTMVSYNRLEVVVYLDVRATAWNKTVGAQSMTLNITPYYRLDVVKDAMGTNDKAFTVKTGSALSMTGLTSDYGDVEIDVTSLLDTGKSLAGATVNWAHHGDYAYKVTDKKFTTSHGFSPFVLTKDTPVAAVLAQGETSLDNAKAYYMNVQTAIDETEDEETVKLYTVYNKTAETYNFSGKARTITFDPGINGTFVPTFSGASVTADKTNGNVWRVQLNEDTTPANTRITMNTAGNGSATVNVSSAKPGSSVSGTYKANSGYKAGSFTATAQPGNKSVSVSVSANGTFSFTVPSDATSVTVTPSFVLDNGLPFTDVANNAWYFTAVKYCYDTTNNGYRLMEGDSAATFAPNGSFTRAHMVQILWNMKGRPTPRTTANPFRDMSSSNWYYSAVLWAYENGYAKGYPDGTFKPGQAVTRQEMVQFLYQASGSPSGSGNLSYYSDGYTANNWAQPALRWATGLGILSGQNSASLGNTLAPRAVAKRCEVAVTVMNFDKLNLF